MSLTRIADAFGRIGEQLYGETEFDVLGQHEHSRAGMVMPDVQGGLQPLVGMRRRKPDVDDDDIRHLVAQSPTKLASISGGTHCRRRTRCRSR
jgi:hypothetical protein